MSKQRNASLTAQPGVYTVLMDWWVATVVLLFLAVFVVAVPYLLWSKLSWLVIAVTIGFALFVILYVVDVMFFTYYYLDTDALIITSQLRYFSFPYRTMTKIKRGNVFSLLSRGGHRRFALSTHCYTIQMEGAPWNTISVSPKEQDKFMNRLLHNIDIERSRHATIDAPKKIA